jgi:colanic acid biosynthesis protein WcaH
MNPEPEPGQRLATADFDAVVRLTPLIAIDLIVRDINGKVLLGRRKYEPAKGTLFIPGGRITKNERLAAAFERVSHAELGVTKAMADACFVGVYEHIYRTNNHELPGFGTHYITLGYELNAPLQASALPKDQHGEYVWQTEAELLASADVHENTKMYFR